MTIFERLLFFEIDVDHILILFWLQGLALNTREVFTDHLARAKIDEEIHTDIQDDRVVNWTDEQIQGDNEVEQADDRNGFGPNGHARIFEEFKCQADLGEYVTNKATAKGISVKWIVHYFFLSNPKGFKNL